MTLSIEENVPPDPADIGFFRPAAVMADANRGLELIEEHSLPPGIRAIVGPDRPYTKCLLYLNQQRAKVAETQTSPTNYRRNSGVFGTYRSCLTTRSFVPVVMPRPCTR